MPREFNISNDTVGDIWRDYWAVTPHDADPLPNGPSRGIYAGGAGTVRIRSRAGATPVDVVLPAGGTFQGWVYQVLATGTDATDLIAGD